MKEGRLITIVLILMICFFGLLVSVFLLSSNVELYRLAAEQSEATINLSAGRGDIFDCNLEPLTSTTSKVYALAVTGEDAYSEYFRRLTTEDQQLAYELYNQKTPYLIELNELLSDNPYEFTDSSRYLDLQIASNIIGYLDNSALGAQGIEKAYNDLLERGGVIKDIVYDKDAIGSIMMSTQPQVDYIYGTGEGIILTIDKTIQRIGEGLAEQYLDKGAIVVMESKTGRIKAAVSTPMLYPNDILTNIEEDDGAFINRPATAYNIGSVIKPLMAAELIETGGNTDVIYECSGSIEVNGHIMVDDYLVSESGVLPTSQQLEDLGERASFSFGQGMVMATPIQMTAALNIFANEGMYITPTLVEGIYNQLTDRVDESFYSPTMRRVISQQTAETVGGMLESVVPVGTADEAQPIVGTAAGKSCTAQTGRYIPHELLDFIPDDPQEKIDETVAWFVGYYPADDPKYTITIMQEGSYSLGEEMGEIFSQLCNSLRYYDEDLSE